MNDYLPEPDRDAITPPLRRLGDRLAWQGVVADVYVVPGGGTMVLAYDVRRSSRHIDSLFKPHSVFTAEVGAVAVEHGLPPRWLDRHANAYVSDDTDPLHPLIFDHPGLRIQSGCPWHLLTMKVLASRHRDTDDIRALVSRLSLSTVDDVLAACRGVYPEEAVPERAILLIEDALN